MSARATAPRVRGVALLVVLAAVLVPLAFAIRAVASGDVTSLIARGAASKTDAFFAAEAPEVARRSDVGHDGQQFYVVARTFPNLDDAAPYLDRPRDRLRRILLPAIASLFGSGRRYAIGVLALNIAAAAAAAAAFMRIADRAGLPRWAAIGVAVSPGVILAVQLSLADVVAVALASWAVATADRLVPSVVLCALAGFARETALLAALALLIRTRRWWYLLPFGAVGGWAVFLTDRYGSSPFEIFGLPFDSWFRFGIGHGLLITSLAAGEAWAAWVMRRRAPLLALWAAAEAVLLVFVGPEVAFEGNVARAVPLATVAMTFGLATLAASRAIGPSPSLRPGT